MKPKILPDIMAMVRLLPLLGLLLMYSHQIVAQTSSATITTDKDDYAPGETAIITGTGWWPGETVELDFEHIEPNIPDHVHVTKYVTADESGNIYFEWYVDEQELGTTFHLMARGQSSGYFAETFFTDGNVTFSVSGIPPSHSVTVSYKFRNPTGANNDANSTTSSQQTTFTIGARNNSPVKFSYQTVSTSGGINYHLSNVGIDAGSLSTGTEGYQYEFQSPSGARTVTANYGVLISTNKTATYGGSVTLTSSFYSNYQTSTGIVGKPITFYINGTAVGTVNTQTGGVASLTLDLTNVPTLGKLNAGTYDITTSFAGDSELLPVPQTSSTGSTLTVDRKALTVTADNQSKTYGDTFSFDGTEFSTAGLVNSDAVSSATIASDGAAATATVDGAPYAINISAATGTGLSNYDITYVPGSFAVGKKALTVTADNQSKTYGDTFSFDGTEFSTAGLVNSDAVSSATIASDGAAATATVDGAPYAINISAATGTGLSNYDITYVPGSFAVGKKALTVTADNQSKTYGDTFSFDGTEFSTAGLVNSDAVSSATIASDGAAATATVDGAPYAINISAATGTGLSNYDITYVPGSFAVGKKALTVTADNQSKTYGDTFSFDGTEFSTAGLVNSDAVSSATIASDGAAATATVDGAPYAINISAATGTGLSNYDITYVPGSFAVGKKALTVTADNQSKTYGDTFSFDGTEFSTAGLVNSDAVSSATIASDGAAATATVDGAPYAINISAATGTGLSNYDITYVPGSFAVGKKALTVTADNQSKTYGDTFSFDGTEFSTAGLVNSDAVSSATITSDGAAATATVDGAPYAINISAATGTGLSNYDITYVPGSFAVGKKALTVTADNQSKTYGDTFSFDGTEFSTAGLVNSDAVSSATIASDGAAATATVDGAPYAINISAATGTGLSNYDITYVPGSFAVGKKALTVTADNQSKTYGDTFSFDGTEFSTAGLVNSDAVSSATITSDGAAATATVDGAPYAINISAATGTGLSNYDITYVPGSFAVGKKALTVTADNQSKTYGDTFSFDGTEFSTAGLVNSDAVSSATIASDGAAATATVDGAPYAINISAATGTGLSNYDITYVPGSFAVGKKALTVTADNQSKTYGDTFSFDGTEFSASGLVNSDAVSSATITSDGAAATATVDGAPYAINISAATGTGLSNYDITYVPGSFAVGKKALTVTADNQSKTYGDTFSFDGTEFSTAGLVNSDAVSSATIASDGAAATATVDGAPYAINISAATGTGLSNYDITYVPGSFAVGKKALTVTADNQSKTYGDTFSFDGTEFSASGLVNSDAVSSATITSDGAAATATVDGAPYAINISAATGTGLSNYDITYVPGSFAVGKKALTVTADDKSKYCGQDDPELTYQITSGTLVNGDGFTGSLERESGDAAGTYKISQGSLTLGTNYDLTVIEGEFTINAISSLDATQTFVNIQINNTGQLSATISPAVANVPVTFTIYHDDNVTVLRNIVGNTNASGVATVSWTAPGTIGVYKVDVMAGSSACDAKMEAYVTVFDPSDSFVTGGGWINSPAGAMPDRPDAEGRANFGFVSRYKKGRNNLSTNEVDGNTEFQFQAGDLNFKSTLHESGSLVISGARATYRGTGTINGQPGFRFMVVAIDGDWNGQRNPDRFRIKITTTNGTVIYDNQIGKAENTDDATVLGNNGTGGGSIVIHEVKGKGPNKNVMASMIEVPWNTPVEVLEKELQQMASSWFEGEKFAITLDPVDYNPLEPGFYQVGGYFENNPWFERNEIIPVPVMVLNKAMAQDILIDNNLMGKDLQAGTVVGRFSTVDAVDNIHTYSIEENPFFVIENNNLVWRGIGTPDPQVTLRVSSTDRAGQTISRDIQLFRETGPNSLLIYPNPAMKETNLLVNLAQESDIEIRIFDAAGRLVFTEDSFQKESFVKNINLDQLSQGLYHVVVKVNHQYIQGRLVKQ